MVRPLSEEKKKNSNNSKEKEESEKGRFVNYVNGDIWSKLAETESLSEMQQWVNTFVQQDSGILANESSFIVNFIEQLNILWNRILFLGSVFGITIIIFIGLYFYHLDFNDLKWFIPTFSEFGFKIQETQLKVSNISNKTENLELQIKNTSTEIKRLREEIKQNFNLNEKYLHSITYNSFVFNSGKKEVKDLPKEEQMRLKLIADNVKLKKWKIIIFHYDDNEKLNRERAINIKQFFEANDVPEDFIAISNEFGETKFFGVQVKLLQNDVEYQ